MILTFGRIQHAQAQEGASVGVSEELRDDNINKQIQEAQQLKSEGEWERALEKYKADSKIDRHVHMVYGSRLNMGEIYENLGNYLEAKNEYTKALKIKEQDSFLWTKLGLIQYEKFKDYNLAKKCFEAAIQTASGTERRSNKISQILMKLAEIAFKEFNFKESEQLVDSILGRRNDKDVVISINSFLLKSFFLSLRDETELAEEFFSRAQQLNPNCAYQDLSIIKEYVQAIQEKLRTKDIIISDLNDENGLNFITIKKGKPQNVIEMVPLLQEKGSFMHIFDDYLMNLATQCEKFTAKELCSSEINNDQYLKLLEQNKDSITANWESNIFAYGQKIIAFEDQFTQENQPSASQKQVNNQKVSKARNQNEKRQLRNQATQNDNQTKNSKAEPIFHLKRYLQTQIENSNYSESQLTYIYSLQEVINAKKYLTDSQLNLNNENMNQIQNDVYLQHFKQSLQNLNKQQFIYFTEFLQKTNGKGVYYVIKNAIRYVIDNNLFDSTGLVNMYNACALYRLFLILINNDFQRYNLEQLKSFKLILTIFEMSLFNKFIIKHVKSTGIIQQREKMYEYLLYEQPMAEHEFETSHGKLEDLRIRFYYCMMYYSFEIKTNMSGSINYYDKLNIDYLSHNGPIYLPWTSSSFGLDQSQVFSYGCCKIKEAMVVKDYDERLTQFKQREYKELEQNKKAGDSKYNRIKNEFEPFTDFYFNQLCQYLQKNHQREGSINPNFTSNEEKILEMWQKFNYCICRCKSPHFFKIVSHLFSFLVAFQHEAKTFYDGYILKKLEFESILCEISERLQPIFKKSLSNFREKQQNLQQGKDFILQKLQNLFGVSLVQSPMMLLKMQSHLLRLMTKEFIYYNLTQNTQRFQDQCFQLIYSYMSSLFQIEMFVAILNSGESQNINEQLKSLCFMLTTFDLLASQNNQNQDGIFVKPYFKLLSVVFPVYLNLLNNSISSNKELFKNIDYDEPLVSQILIMVESIFGIKIKNIERDSQKQQKEDSEDHEMEDESKEASTEDDKFALSYDLDFIQKQILNKKGQNLKIYIQSQSGLFDLYFYDNLIAFFNFLSQNKFSDVGLYEERDSTRFQSLIDSILKFLSENKDSLTSKCIHAKEIEQSLINGVKLNPFKVLSKLDFLNASCRCNSSEPTFPQALERVTFFVLNYYFHYQIESSPHQIQKQNKKGQQLSEEALLKTLSSLDMTQYPFSSEIHYIQSLIFNDMFTKQLETKLLVDSNPNPIYGLKKKDKINYFYYSQNSCLMAIQSLFNEVKLEMNRDNFKWVSFNHNQKFKLYVNQLLQLIMLKRQASKFYFSWIEENNMDIQIEKRQKKATKIRSLETTGLFLVQICDLLDRLSNITVDPRNQDKIQNSQQTFISLIEFLLRNVDKVNTNQETLKQLMNEESLDEGFRFIDSVSKTWKESVQGIQFKINFQHSYIQALLEESLNKQVEKPSMKWQFIQHMGRALQIALVNRQFNGILECYVELVRASLESAHYFKINSFKVGKEETSIMREILNQVKPFFDEDGDVIKFLKEFISKLPQAVDLSQEGVQKQSQLSDKTSTSIRPQLLKEDSIPEYNEFETVLNRIYYSSEKVLELVSQVQKPFFRCQLNLVLGESLWQELETYRGKIRTTTYSLIPPFLLQTFDFLKQYEDTEIILAPIKEQKNLVSLMFNSVFKTTDVKMKFRSFYIDIHQKALNYQGIRDIFKRYLVQYKEQFKAPKRKIETEILFKKSKDMYIDTLCDYISEQLEKYLGMRQKLIEGQNNKESSGFKEQLQNMRLFRNSMQVTKENCPTVLKDIVEIFVDVHQLIKKNQAQTNFFLSKYVNDLQKRQIRLGFLKCCAFCGPDSEFDKSKISTEFLDLSKITLDDYVCEGLQIGLKWYKNVLEEKNSKKDTDILRKLQPTLQEIDKMVKEQKRQVAQMEESEASKVFKDAQADVEMREES